MDFEYFKSKAAAAATQGCINQIAICDIDGGITNNIANMPTLGNERELMSEIWKLIRGKNGSDFDSAFQKINNNRQTFSNKI